MGVHIPLSQRRDRSPHNVKERERTSALASRKNALIGISHEKWAKPRLWWGAWRNVRFFVVPREIK